MTWLSQELTGVHLCQMLGQMLGVGGFWEGLISSTALFLPNSYWLKLKKWSEVNFTSCPTLCDHRDYTVRGILQARILEWVDFPFSRGSSQPRDWTRVSHIAGGFCTGLKTSALLLMSIDWRAELWSAALIWLLPQPLPDWTDPLSLGTAAPLTPPHRWLLIGLCAFRLK